MGSLRSSMVWKDSRVGVNLFGTFDATSFNRRVR